MQNLKDTTRLRPKYYLLSSLVAIAGVIPGSWLSTFVLPGVLNLLGVLVTEHGISNFGIKAGIGIIVSISISYYLGIVFCAGIFGLYNLAKGRLNGAEVFYYALISRYPKSWFLSFWRINNKWF